MRKRVLVLGYFLIVASAYLQLEVGRIELKTELKKSSLYCLTKQTDEQIVKADKSRKVKHSNDEDAEDQNDQIDNQKIDASRNYKQICYEKDIAYLLPLYLQKELYMFTLDTTIPISWIKDQKCHIEGRSSKKCSKLEFNFKETVKQILPHRRNSQKAGQYAMIQGSSQLIKGLEQKGQNLTFRTRDTSRMSSILELLMLGFYITTEKTNFALEKTTFLHAVQLSQNMNYLADGGISLRFDEMSENSFLNELFTFQGTTKKFVTFFFHDKGGIITIGDICTKFALYGYGGIQWISISQDENYGKLPTIRDVIIGTPQEGSFIQTKDKEYPAVISASASYLGLPKDLLNRWLKTLSKKAGCSIDDETNYLECRKLVQEDKQRTITFTLDSKHVSFQLQDLVLSKSRSQVRFNIKKTMHEQYAVLGAPLFLKYFVVFDFTGDRIGISAKNTDYQPLINEISLIRFVCFIFFLGCSFIVCFNPIKRFVDIVKSRNRYQPMHGAEGKRLKSYSPAEQNHYDQLSGQIDQALQQA